MTDKPWYQDGLRFQCTGCGNCCTGAPGFVWVNKAEIDSLAALLGITVQECETRYVRQVGVRKSLIEFANGDCVFFNNQTRRCEIYEARPRQCCSWPFWESNVRTPETWQTTCDACPGCGRGSLVPVDEIQARVAKFKV
jgi:uncharacterized protein